MSALPFTRLRRIPKLCVRSAADRICHNNSRSTSTTTSIDEDPCLTWARANRETAQACLNPPAALREPTDRADEDSSCFWKRIEEGRANWEDYWDWRQWDFSACANEQAVLFGQAIATRALTTPLTIFHSLRHTLRMNAQANDLDLGPESERNHLWWCCLGARSEASLPIEYWKELLVLINQYDRSKLQHQRHCGSPMHLHIDFCGPEMDARRPNVCVTTNSKATLTLRWVYQGKYHDYYDSSQADKDGPIDYDAFLLFNPGVGHPHLREDWLPTLDLLLDDKRERPRSTVLLTAHSEYDASRDAAAVYNNTMNIQVDYAENPFSAKLEYQDPLLYGHRVRPNHFVAVVSKEKCVEAKP